jgi:hypothetical protein
MLREIVGEQAIRELLQAGMEEAKKDINNPWSFFFASKLVGAPKPQSPPIELDFGVDDTPAEMAKTIMHAVAKGDVNPDAAQALLSALSSLNTITEVEDMQRQIAELRELLGKTA